MKRGATLSFNCLNSTFVESLLYTLNEGTYMKKEDKIEDFDFGFSFADEEIEEVKESFQELIRDDKEKIEDLKNRLNLLYSSIVPFLDNLCKNPDKSTIHWPNRVEKIQEYKIKLKQIVEGS